MGWPILNPPIARDDNRNKYIFSSYIYIYSHPCPKQILNGMGRV